MPRLKNQHVPRKLKQKHVLPFSIIDKIHNN